MSDMWVVKVDRLGRITFPADLMKKMGWHAGDTLLFKEVEGGIEVRRVIRSQKP